jgi:hypothetical protein
MISPSIVSEEPFFFSSNFSKDKCSDPTTSRSSTNPSYSEHTFKPPLLSLQFGDKRDEKKEEGRGGC